MKRYLIYIIIASAGFLASCKKEHLTTNTNASPVFYFKGLVGNSAMDLQAGINNYYMYSSYNQDSNGVYNYTGSLKEYNCTSSCPPSIEFIINNYRTSGTGATEPNIDSSLSVNYYKFLIPGGNSTSFRVTFTPEPGSNTNVKSYNWNFGDGSFLNGTGNPDSIIHTYAHPGNYNTSINTVFADNTSSSLNNILQMAQTNNDLNCSVVYTLSTNTFTANISGGMAPYTSYWTFGDGATGTLSTPTASSADTIMHTYIDTIINNVTLKVIDSKHDSITVFSKASGTGNQSDLMSYRMSSPVLLPNILGLSNITVNYTDATGDIYTSNNPAQPDSSYFQITSMSDYQANENGQSTKQLHIKFDCIVFDSKGNTLAIKNGDAVIAVAYK